VSGVSGGSGYGGLTKALSNEHRAARVVSWGAPPPMFFMNFSNQSVHDEAEQNLANQLKAWHESHRDGTIDLIGHSAGCGVALGALARAGEAHVRQVVLLAPSVSPTYDLHPALLHVHGVVHVFHSERDTT